MYVRTIKGNIYKVQDIDEIFVYVDREVKYIEETNASIDYIHKDNIVKHSKNIIDLLKVGDYVNGHKVHKYNGNIGIVSINELGWTFIAFKDKKYPIETVVTREQFAQAEYKIPEKN